MSLRKFDPDSHEDFLAFLRRRRACSRGYALAARKKWTLRQAFFEDRDQSNCRVGWLVVCLLLERNVKLYHRFWDDMPTGGARCVREWCFEQEKRSDREPR